MNKYYTRACNFYYGTVSKTYIKKKKSVSLNGNNQISFDKIEIINRKKNKIINVKDISKLSTKLKNINFKFYVINIFLASFSVNLFFVLFCSFCLLNFVVLFFIIRYYI